MIITEKLQQADIFPSLQYKKYVYKKNFWVIRTIHKCKSELSSHETYKTYTL